MSFVLPDPPKLDRGVARGTSWGDWAVAVANAVTNGGGGGGASVNTLGTPSNPVTSASAARPTGLTVVYWACPTQPSNWVAGDVWTQTS